MKMNFEVAHVSSSIYISGKQTILLSDGKGNMIELEFPAGQGRLASIASLMGKAWKIFIHYLEVDDKYNKA